MHARFKSFKLSYIFKYSTSISDGRWLESLNKQVMSLPDVKPISPR